MTRRFPIRPSGGGSWIRGATFGSRALPPLPAQLVANAERVLREGILLPGAPGQPSVRVLRDGLVPLRRTDGAS